MLNPWFVSALNPWFVSARTKYKNLAVVHLIFQLFRGHETRILGKISYIIVIILNYSGTSFYLLLRITKTMNRKFVHILLAILLLASTAGISVSKHYCEEILQGISFFSDSGSCSQESSVPMDGCDDKTDHFVLDNDFQAEYSNIKVSTPFHFIQYADINIANELVFVDIQTTSHTLTDPPPDSGTHIYVEVQSFLL